MNGVQVGGRGIDQACGRSCGTLFLVHCSYEATTADATVFKQDSMPVLPAAKSCQVQTFIDHKGDCNSDEQHACL